MSTTFQLSPELTAALFLLFMLSESYLAVMFSWVMGILGSFFGAFLNIVAAYTFQLIALAMHLFH